jgi:O-antigen/teichoic acid export membrane protein
MPTAVSDATSPAAARAAAPLTRMLKTAGVGLTLAAVVQLVAGTVTSKIAASLLGPTGVGIHAVVQAVANIVALLTLGTGEAVIREAGRRRAIDEGTNIGPLMRGAEIATLASLTVVSALSLVIGGPLSRLLFGTGHEETFLLSVAAGVTYAWVMVQVNCLVAQKDVGRVSVALALAASSTPAVAFVGYHWWGVDGVGRVHLGAMLASLLTTGLLTRRGPSASHTRAALRASIAEIPGLVRYGVPHVAGVLLTASMLLIVPVMVRADLGVDAAGYYRAAATVAAGMATLFTFVLNNDFAARIAEAAPDPASYSRVLAAQLRSVLVRGVVTVLALSLLAPVVVRILYADGFGPTADILPAMLVGQLLGIVALTVNLGVGARHGSGRMLVNAAIGGLATMAAVSLAAGGGLQHVALAFVVGQTVFLAACLVSTITRDGWAPLRIAGPRPPNAPAPSSR